MDKLEEIYKGLAGEQETQQEVQSEEVEVVENSTEENQEDVVENEETEQLEEVEESSEEKEETQEEENTVNSEWDSEEDNNIEVKEESSSQPDYGLIAKELGLEGDFKNKESFVSSLKDEISKLKSKEFEVEKVLSDIPDGLMEAVKIAKEGGDFLEYLNVGSVDYSSYSDEELVSNSLADYFLDEEGKVNEEDLRSYVEDNYDQKKLSIEASRIRKALNQNKEIVKNKILEDANRKKEARLNKISETLNGIESISGYKINTYQKSKLLNDFKEDSVIKNIFYTNGAFDEKKAIENYFKVINFDKIDAYRKTRIKNETKRQVIEEMSNEDLGNKGNKTDISEKQDPLDSYLKNLKQRK